VLNNFKFTAILDSDSEVDLSERIYKELIEKGVDIPILPVEGVVFVTAFGRRSKRICRQALLEFSIGRDVFETILLISPQLNNDAIFGCQFLHEHGVTRSRDSIVGIANSYGLDDREVGVPVRSRIFCSANSSDRL
jgi:hypothetical protein